MTSVSPIAINQAPQLVLDVCTGTGDWAIGFAKRSPSSWVIGTDLSVVQRKLTSPLNCEFKIENARVNWTYCELFDFIHSRILCLGIHHWPHYLRWCFDTLKPGGCPKNKYYRFLYFQLMAPPNQILHSLGGQVY